MDDSSLRPEQREQDYFSILDALHMYLLPSPPLFTPPPPASLPPPPPPPSRLTQAASASWDQLKSQTSASVKKAVQDRKQLELDVTLQSPFIVIPEKGLYTDSAHLLVADLGRLSLFGHTTDSKVSTIKVCGCGRPSLLFL